MRDLAIYQVWLRGGSIYVSAESKGEARRIANAPADARAIFIPTETKAIARDEGPATPILIAAGDLANILQPRKRG